MENRLLFACGSAVALSLLLSAGSVGAEEPAFTNPNPRFRPLTVDQVNRLLPGKLGVPPDLSKRERRKIAAGKVVVQELSVHDEDRRNQAIGLINAPQKAVMVFLRDYPARVGVVPHVKKIAVTWIGNLALVDQTLKVAFKTIRYRLQYLHYGDAMVEWEYLHGDLKDTTGYFKLFPENGGRKTLMVYHVFTRPGSFVPDFIIDMLSRHSMPKVIKGIRKAVMKRRE